MLCWCGEIFVIEMPMHPLRLALLLAMLSNCAAGEEVLISRGSLWKYYYNGAVPAAWNQAVFDDSTWPSGLAQIGWGEGDEKTVAIDDPGYAPTLYFRRTFVASNAPATLTLRLVADDGAVIYLNGDEVLRRNMPFGKPDFLTAATVNVVTNENDFVQFGLFAGTVHAGTNTICVELHQHPDGGQDASFDLELVANIPIATPRVTMRWPTNGAVLGLDDLVLQAQASDADGGIAQVMFYANGAPVGVTSDEIYSYVWHNPPPGRYVLFARALDNIFSSADSDPVHVQIGDVSGPPALIRGPYLQSGSSTGMVVRWRTDWISDSVVRFGTNAGSLDRAMTNTTLTGEHSVRIGGLSPDTFYHYTIGSSEAELLRDDDCHFRTAPTNARPVRIWAIGDSGTADVNAAAVRDAYREATAGKETDVWLMLGDNAYGLGRDEEYQAAVFDMYSQLLRKTVVWPTLGNHDAGEFEFGDADDFGRAFTFPQAGEAGGVPSGSGLYYSFDYANAHFVCLDSFLSDRSTNGAMLSWLRSDLEQTAKDWIIAYWHHPPYSWGDHDSDADNFEIEMRQRVNPLLEQYGVDLVMSGHSHEYERSFLLNGHYGYSWDFLPGMALDATVGREEENGPYRKPALGMGSERGTVYLVCGCSGQGGAADFPLYPAMATNHGGWGSMVIEINDLKLKASFLRPNGDIDDSFTIDKSAAVTNGPALKVARQGNEIIVEWPTSKPAFALQAVKGVEEASWESVTNESIDIGRTRRANIEASATNRFFRLKSED